MNLITKDAKISAGAKKLRRFIRNARWDNFPAEVREAAKLCFLDTLGAALAGKPVPATAIAAAYAGQTLAGKECTIISSGRTSSPAGAAFANGCAANAIDIDDCGIYTWGHPGAIVFPAALAIAELKNAPGTKLLSSLVVGYEVAFRAGRCINAELARREPDPALFHDFRACASWGAIAAAAAGAHLLALTPEQAGHALGIADYWSPQARMMQAIDHPAMVKHGIAMGAMVGVMAAQLAKMGFTGPVSIIEEPAYAAWAGELGTTFFLPQGVNRKEWSCCAWTHSALHAVAKIKRAHNFSHEQIKRIHVKAHHYTKRLGVKLPATTEEAQFNLAWPIAAFIIDGEIGPRQVLGKRLNNPMVRALAAKVAVTEFAPWTRAYYASESSEPRSYEAAEVTIRLADGRTLRSGETRLPGYGEIPWGRQQAEAKFHRLAAGILPAPAAAKLVNMVWRLETLSSARELTKVIRKELRG